MKKMAFALSIVLFGSSLAFAAEPISKQEAENNALEAVGGGEVLTSTLESKDLTKDWKVDIAGSTNEYEVKVDATSGQILKVTSQSLTNTGFISKARAEQLALAAVGGGQILQATLDTVGKHDRKVWSVDILGSAHEYEVWIDAHTGALVKTITQPLAMLGSPNATTTCQFITKAMAEKTAFAAVGASKMIAATLDKTDRPVTWSVDVVTPRGAEYEVNVNACTDKVLTIIIGG